MIHDWIISIHALRGEGDLAEARRQKELEISIHALRGEGDTLPFKQIKAWDTFQSTPSVGRAT